MMSMRPAVTVAAVLAAAEAFRIDQTGSEIAGKPGVLRHEYITFKRHHVFRRSMNDEHRERHVTEFNLPFSAFNKEYNLQMAPNQHIFSANATIAGKPVHNIGYYKGKLLGHNDSFAHIHVNEEGDVSGTFWEHPTKGSFYIRPAESEAEGSHIIYQEAHNPTHDHKTAGTCGADELEPPKATAHSREAERRHRARRVAASPWSSARDQDSSNFKTYCEMALFGDRAFMEQYGSNTATGIALMIERFSIAQEVMNSRVTQGGNGAELETADVQLKIHWLDFYKEDASPTPEAQEIDEYVRSQSTTVGYLEQFSRFDWSPYCLAQAYTYKDFEGTLGLAWTAYPDSENHNGGICQARYNDGTIGGMVSLNTAWHSSLNFGAKQTESQSALVLSHEIGHNFGSPHDLQDSGSNGNYVMYKYAVSGSKANNKKFSEQSKNAINAAMRDRAGCFQNSSRTFCGNKIIEDGEVCDNGGVAEIDPCCEATLGVCSLALNANCSALDKTFGECCSNCGILTSGNCGVQTECRKIGTCASNGTGCIQGEDKPDLTICEPGLILSGTGDNAKGGSVCRAGKCDRSLCDALGLADCEGEDADYGEDACQLHCRVNGVCESITSIPSSYSADLKWPDASQTDTVLAGGTPWTKRKGASCEFENNEPLSGVCDSDRKCVAADAEEDTLGELYKQYNQLKDTFLTWVNGEKSGLPIWAWLTIAGVLLVMSCCGGCYVANKPAITTFKEEYKATRKAKKDGNAPANQPHGI